MNSEQDVPETQVHQGPPQGATSAGEHHSNTHGEDGQNASPGTGQSKSSRRRRRKRKGKSADNAGLVETADHTSTGEGPAESSVNLQAVSSAPSENRTDGPPQGGRGRTQQQTNGTGFAPGGSAAPGGTKRWKKNFRDRDRSRPQDNSGRQSHGSNGTNSFSSNGGGDFAAANNGSQNNVHRDRDTHQPGNNAGFKRKAGFSGGKQQRPAARGFVGPMDHSYRAVNGNFQETPPSTIEPHGSYGGGRARGYQGDSQPIDYSQGRTIPVAADAPTKIYFFIEDLFFIAKIQETARKLGVKVGFVKNDKESLATLTGVEEADRPGLIVIDLNNANAKPLTLVPKLKTKLKRSTSIVGFLSHLQGDLKAKAVEAGCDTVMPRAAFSQNLPNLLRRYGIEDTEDTSNYNQ